MEHKRHFRYISPFIHRINGKFCTVYLLTAGDIRLGDLQFKRLIPHLKILYLFQVPFFFYINKYGVRCGIALRIFCLCQHIISYRQILQAHGPLLRIIIPSLICAGNFPEIIIILYDWMISACVRDHAACGRHLLTILICSGPECEYPSRFIVPGNSIFQHRKSLFIQYWTV